MCDLCLIYFFLIEIFISVQKYINVFANISKLIGVCTDTYVFYQSVLEKKTDWSGVSQRT